MKYDLNRTLMMACLLVMGILFLLIQPTKSNAFAMGDNPYSCTNLGTSRIILAQINNGTKIFDPALNSGTRFDANINEGYSIYLILDTSSAGSDEGSENRGSLWYTTTAYGFSSGQCIPDLDSEKIKTFSLHNIIMGQANNGTTQQVTWGSWPNVVQISYAVHWHS